MYGRMKGWRGGGGRFAPKSHFLQIPLPNSAKGCGVRWQIRRTSNQRSPALPLVASHPLDLPGTGVQETWTPKAGALESQLAGAANSHAVTAAPAGSLPQVWFMLLAEHFFSAFWILLWNFFLLGLFLGQCSPDIWFTVNSIDYIGLSQEMEEIAFSFFLSPGWQLSLSAGLAKLCECATQQREWRLCLRGWTVTQGRKWARGCQLKGLPSIQVFPPR